MVVDACPRCQGVGDIDLSPTAWNTVTANLEDERVLGNWNFVKCPRSFLKGSLILRFSSWSNPWHFDVQPLNAIEKIISIEIETENGGGHLISPRDHQVGFYYWRKTNTMDPKPLTVPAKFIVKNNKGHIAWGTLDTLEDLGNRHVHLNAKL